MQRLPRKTRPDSSTSILPNGARYYVDHAHPEFSSPECSEPSRPRDLGQGGRARSLRHSIRPAKEIVPHSAVVLIYKTTPTARATPTAYHENYLVDRHVPFARLVKHLIPFFVTRTGLYGGREGRLWRTGVEASTFRSSQRADFFEVEVGLETTSSDRSSTRATSRTPTLRSTADCMSSSATRRCPRSRPT